MTNKTQNGDNEANNLSNGANDLVDKGEIAASLREQSDKYGLFSVKDLNGEYFEVTAEFPRSNGQLFPEKILSFMAGNGFSVTWIGEVDKIGYEGTTTVGFSRGADLNEVFTRNGIEINQARLRDD